MIMMGKIYISEFEVLTATSMNMAYSALCSLVQVYRRFRGACYLHHPDDGGSKHSEMSINFYQTTWSNNPEDSIFKI
jgi:hypothetical protein